MMGVERRGGRRGRSILRHVRLVTGLTLFTYLVTHYLNHALGNVSLQAMELGREPFEWLWRGWIGSAALYGALVTHAGLGIWALYERRWFRITPGQVLQLLLGLTVPALLFEHIIGTRLIATFYGVDPHYPQLLWIFWVNNPVAGARQSLVLLIAWTHGCIGLYYWLRLKPSFRRLAPMLFAGAILLPILALLGFAQGGREVAVMSADPVWLSAMLKASNMGDATATRATPQILVVMRVVYGGLIATALLGRGLRVLLERRRGILRVTYPDGRVARAPAGVSLLDVSRMAKIPHAGVCGGRGRCSTCRVRVLSGLDRQPPPAPAERAVLAKVGADVMTRLACQLHPVGDITVAPLLPPDAAVADLRERSRYRAGQERFVAILFTDMRGSTPIAEKRLPYDIVFLLNRFFETIGSAVIEAGGFPNQFIGDSVMALFGLEVGPEEGCRQALAAARAIAARLDALNDLLKDDLPIPIRIGIGIHAGTAIVGEMGYRETSTVTAVGDPVHVAARLQELTKTYKCQMVVSDTVGERAGIDLGGFERQEIQVRGRQEPLSIRIVPGAADLPEPDAPPPAHRRAPMPSAV